MHDNLTPRGKNISSNNISCNNNLSTLDFSNFNYDLNNKISFESSHLISGIKLKKKLFIKSDKKEINKIYIKKILLPEEKRISKIIDNKKLLNQSKKIKNLSGIEYNQSKILLPKLKNLNKTIYLSSLFKIPKPKTRNKINMNQLVIKNNNFSLNLHKNKSLDEHIYKKKNNFGVGKFMKENYYSDIENKYQDLIKTKYFRNDSFIKNEIISIKKFGGFWNRLIEYCAPIIHLKKYQYLRKFLDNKKKNDNNISSLSILNNI